MTIKVFVGRYEGLKSIYKWGFLKQRLYVCLLPLEYAKSPVVRNLSGAFGMVTFKLNEYSVCADWKLH
jgi:hypothetical protein